MPSKENYDPLPPPPNPEYKFCMPTLCPFSDLGEVPKAEGVPVRVLSREQDDAGLRGGCDDEMEKEMATKKTVEKDVLLVELDLHKEEFKSLRQEILQLIESERQYLNLSLVAFGAGTGLRKLTNETTKIY
jgi:hypothetical protein